MTKNVLFVCTGNTCRSPMAEQLFRKMLRKRKLEDQVQARSAGINPGSSLSKNAEITIAEKCGANDFVGPRRIEQEQGAQLDYVFVMEQSQIDKVIEVLGESEAEIITLKAAANLSGDIRDPIGKGIEAYKETANEIEVCLERILQKFTSSFRRNSEITPAPQ